MKGLPVAASIKPYRDELGVGDGLLLIDGEWTTGTAESGWSHRHPATGEDTNDWHQHRGAVHTLGGPAAVRAALAAAGEHRKR